MTLLEIETEVIPTLTLTERLRLIRRLASDAEAENGAGEGDEEAWDSQMAEDCKPGGKLDALFNRALDAHRRGETEEWP